MAELYEEHIKYCSKCNKNFDAIKTHCPNCNNELLEKHITWHLKDHAYFLKITNKKVVKSLRKGVIWFRSPLYYQQIEKEQNGGNNIIGDEREFLVYVSEKDNKYDPKIKNKMIFCLYMLTTDEDGNYNLSPEEKKLLKQFGDSVTFLDFYRFKKFMENKLIKLVSKISANNVSYYTECLEGYINPFFKRDTYKYQNEYRVILDDEQFKNDKFIFKNKFNLKKIFSQPIDLEIILNSTNEKEWYDKIKFY